MAQHNNVIILFFVEFKKQAKRAKYLFFIKQVGGESKYYIKLTNEENLIKGQDFTSRGANSSF